MCVVSVHDSLETMTGIGEEWLLDSNGNIIVVLINGNLRVQAMPGNSEVTKVA